MSVRLLFEEVHARPGKLWRLTCALLFLIGVGALAYTGWFYLEGYLRERSESEAFDRAREAPPARQAPVPPAEKFSTAKLRIPRLGLWTMVKEGVGDKTLRSAAGHIPSTALPGRPGNVGIAAHRDT